MRHLFKTVALLILSTAIGACNSGSATGYSAPDNIYTMRGKITKLPAAAAADKPREMNIHHEAVGNFRNSSGEVDPMPEMTMPFPLAEHISLEGITVGDAVEFRYEVRWKGQPHELVTAMKKIPAGSVQISEGEK